MAERKEPETVNETIMGQGTASSSRLAAQDTVSRNNMPGDHPTYLASRAMSTTSTFRADHVNQMQPIDQGVYYPSYGYVYQGFDGSYPRWKNNGYFFPSDGSGLPYSTTQPHNGTYFKDGTKGFSSAGRFTPQGQGGQFFPRIRTSVPAHRPISNNVTREKFNQRRRTEGPNDVICGPRANRKNDILNSEDGKDCLNSLIRDQYNLSEFQIRYEHAKFFMIKSYNEDDVHKSIKYNVWASTPSGNVKLDDAFKDAEARMKETATKCPIFLFFSVNTSGKFLGVAEMSGAVDFKKNMGFWQEERWNGFFPLRWHIIKDVPNVEFRSIILENNDNRPVFFSRDTQEIHLPQGLQMLQIFKSYNAETSILDDFPFYDVREKSLRAGRDYIPSLVRSEEDAEEYTSTRHVEEAMEKMEISSRPKTTTTDISFLS